MWGGGGGIKSGEASHPHTHTHTHNQWAEYEMIEGRGSWCSWEGGKKGQGSASCAVLSLVLFVTLLQGGGVAEARGDRVGARAWGGGHTLLEAVGLGDGGATRGGGGGSGLRGERG